LGVGVEAVKNIFIWGNHSSTQYPDARNGIIKKGNEEVKLVDALPDQAWIQDQFVSVLKNVMIFFGQSLNHLFAI
jgi:malate dehydrogenase